MTRGAGGTLSLTRGPGALTHSPPSPDASELTPGGSHG